MSVLVTGATGFVGKAFCAHMLTEGRVARGVIRGHRELLSGLVARQVHDISADTDWSEALKGIRNIVHLAARVHVMQDNSANQLAEFRRVNVEGTLNLARQAANAGIQRFVFVSSVKVNGETTEPGHPFTADDAPAPEDAYGLSKHEAEQGLWLLSAETGMEVVIIRPPLVYGPGVKANFERMMRWLASGMPLPLGALVNNRRSLLALDNLVDLLRVCLDHPSAAGQTFMASDDEDLSTAELLRRMGLAMSRPATLVSVPPALLKWGAGLLGQAHQTSRLLGNLQVDIGKTRALLGWTPPVNVDDALKRTAAGRIS